MLHSRYAWVPVINAISIFSSFYGGWYCFRKQQIFRGLITVHLINIISQVSLILAFVFPGNVSGFFAHTFNYLVVGSINVQNLAVLTMMSFLSTQITPKLISTLRSLVVLVVLVPIIASTIHFGVYLNHGLTAAKKYDLFVFISTGLLGVFTLVTDNVQSYFIITKVFKITKQKNPKAADEIRKEVALLLLTIFFMNWGTYVCYIIHVVTQDLALLLAALSLYGVHAGFMTVVLVKLQKMTEAHFAAQSTIGPANTFTNDIEMVSIQWPSVHESPVTEQPKIVLLNLRSS
jgi:hypothetical protein